MTDDRYAGSGLQVPDAVAWDRASHQLGLQVAQQEETHHSRLPLQVTNSIEKKISEFVTC